MRVSKRIVSIMDVSKKLSQIRMSQLWTVNCGRLNMRVSNMKISIMDFSIKPVSIMVVSIMYQKYLSRIWMCELRTFHLYKNYRYLTNGRLNRNLLCNRNFEANPNKLYLIYKS